MTPYHFYIRVRRYLLHSDGRSNEYTAVRDNKKVLRGIALTLMFLLVVSYAGIVLAQSSDPYTFKRQGIFGCDAGEFASSVGARAAVGGAYVPVNDAAVTINTYQLLYKECILREIVARQREAATAANQRSGLINFLTARNGEPLFPRDYYKDVLDRSDEAFLRYIQGPEINALHPSTRGIIQRGLARGYMSATRDPSRALGCTYEGDIEKFWNGQEFTFSGLIAVSQPTCNPIVEYELAESAANSAIAADRYEMDWRLQASGGIYGIETLDANGRRITLTPGSLVASNVSQLLQTGFKQLENTNDIGQMVGALFSGITAHVVGDTRGLLGLTQSIGGQPSYLDQVARESAQGLRSAAANAALQILAASRQVEQIYNQAVSAIADVLARAIGTLRGRDNECLELIIGRVCTETRTGNECNDTESNKYTIATSTYPFAQNVIDAQIAPPASSTIQNIQTSGRALELLGRLIETISNTASVDAQRVALQQLDALVANRQIHSQYDAQAMQKTQTDITNAMAELVTDTTTAWGDAPDPSVGWCNVNNQAVIDLWKQRWKKP